MHHLKRRIQEFEGTYGRHKDLSLRRQFNALLLGGKRVEKEECEHVVIGGGIAGLKIASEIKGCVLLERSYRLGGRIKTVKKDEKVLYDAGPWRVHESHRRVLAHLSISKEHVIPFDPPISKTGKEMKSMTLFDTIIYRKGLNEALEKEKESGYFENFDTMGANYRHKKGNYFRVPGGFQSLVDVLAKKCDPKNLRMSHRVTDVERDDAKGKYIITCMVKKGNSYSLKKYICRTLFICCPPRAARKWTICRAWLRAQLALVKSYPLNHIYVRGRPAPKKHMITKNELSQIIPGNHSRDWFQASYTGGRLAQFWARLHIHDPKLFMKKLKRLLKAELGKDVSITDHRMHFWKHAVHMWNPGFKADVKEWVERCLVPHPIKLPNLFWAGEAFSSYQGWVEGALETSEKVLSKYRRATKDVGKYTIAFDKKKHLILDGRVLNPTKWKHVHPGSRKAIEAHIGEDISALFRHIDHSDDAWTHAFSIQEGFAS